MQFQLRIKNILRLSLNLGVSLTLLTAPQLTYANNAEVYPTESTGFSPNSVPAPGFLDMITNLPEDWSVWAKETFSRDNANNLIGLTLFSGLLVATDYQTWKLSERLRDSSPEMKKYHAHAVGGGDGYFHTVTALSFATWGFLGDNNRALRTASQIFEAMFATGAVVQLMKHFTGRESPFKSDSWTGDWVPFPEQVTYTRDVQNYDAVPSGHIATAYSTYLVIEANYPDQKWIPWVGYPMIAVFAQGLVGTSIHWWSDIPIGMALGYSFAKIVTRRNHQASLSKLKTNDWTPTIVPMVTPNGPVFTANWEW